MCVVTLAVGVCGAAVAGESADRLTDGARAWQLCVASTVVVALAALLAVWNIHLRRLIARRTRELARAQDSPNPVRDIGERKRVEQALRGEYERFVTVMDALHAQVYVADMDTYDILFVNKSVRELYGDCVGKLCYETFQVDQTGQCAICTNGKLLDADGLPTGPYVSESQNPVTGRWVLNTDQAIHWTDGRIVRLRISTGITEMKRARQELEREDRHQVAHAVADRALLRGGERLELQTVVDAVGPAAAAADRCYIFLKHCDEAGWPVMSQVAEWCADGVPSQTDNAKLQEASFAESAPRWESMLSAGLSIRACVTELPDEERAFLEPQGIAAILILPILTEGELLGFIGLDNCTCERQWEDAEVEFLRSVAANLAQALSRLHAEQARDRLLAELQRSNEALDEFGYVISHDLQEPLRTITSYMNLLERRYETLFDDEAGEFMVFVTDGANRMRCMIQSLLTYARVGTQGEEFAPVACGDVLADVLADLETALNESRGQVEVVGDLPSVVADRHQLVQLFQNLIGNALKFHGEAPPHVKVSACQVEREWVFTVQDNGIGFDPKFAESIFRVFRRLHVPGAYEGTGIGLCVCRKIVERHGGRIWAESEPEQGATFHFTLPVGTTTVRGI